MRKASITYSCHKKYDESPLKNNPFASVKVAEFRNLLMGRFVFIMGLRMMATLVGWWIYLLTNDPFAIGLIGLSEVIPAVSLALYAGHVIDQSEKRKLLLKGIIFYLLAAIALGFYFRQICIQTSS